MTAPTVRAAVVADIPAMSAVLIARSASGSDHQQRPEVLAGWIDAGEPITGMTLVAYPMRKVL